MQLTLLSACLFFAASQAFAQTSGRSIQKFEQTRVSTENSYLNQFYLRPSAGAVSFNGNDLWTSGLIYGFEVLRLGHMDMGITSGLLYSSLAGTVTHSTGDNNFILQIPADVKLSFSLDRERRFRIGPHIGVNLIDNSSHVTTFGKTAEVNSTVPAQPAINQYFNVGGEVLWQISRPIDISLRYDRTFLSAFPLHTITLGVGFNIGFTA
jgi:hypothetical protein